MKWTDIVGHNTTIQMLRHMESSRHMPHAILFTGPSGIGKFTVAKTLATALLCHALGDRPCGSCQSCLQMSYGTHPDFKVIAPDGVTIKIEQIRNLQQEVMLAPYVSSRRVYIIDGAECMTIQAANSLLKILEEPVGEVVFILVSANRQMLLTTILSRCMMLIFQPLTDDVLAGALVNRGFSSAKAQVAAKLSRGRMGAALLMLEPDGFAMRDQATKIIDDLLEGNITMVWDTSVILEKMDRKDLLQLLTYITYLLRDIVMIVTRQEQSMLFNIDIVEQLTRQADRWSEEGLLKALRVVEDTRKALNANANARLTSEALLIKIYNLAREV